MSRSPVGSRWTQTAVRVSCRQWILHLIPVMMPPVPALTVTHFTAMNHHCLPDGEHTPLCSILHLSVHNTHQLLNAVSVSNTRVCYSGWIFLTIHNYLVTWLAMYLIPLHYGSGTIFLIFQQKENEAGIDDSTPVYPVTVCEEELL